MIHREPVNPGVVYRAPRRVTFAYQPARSCFNIWFRADDPKDCLYTVVATGRSVEGELVASAVSDSGFFVFHLIRISSDSPDPAVDPPLLD